MTDTIKPPHAISLSYFVVGECWVFIGPRNEHGYGRVRINGFRKYAHRWSWEMDNGPIPQGLQVCHKCDNPACIRLDHLFLGTFQDNMEDKIAKGRQGAARGEDSGRALVTSIQVKEIRRIYTTNMYSYQELGDRYGLSASAIRYICNGKSWRHI